MMSEGMISQTCIRLIAGCRGEPCCPGWGRLPDRPHPGVPRAGRRGPARNYRGTLEAVGARPVRLVPRRSCASPGDGGGDAAYGCVTERPVVADRWVSCSDSCHSRAAAPQVQSTVQLVHSIRHLVASAAVTATGLRVLVGGETAASIDSSAHLSNRLLPVIVFVVVLSMLCCSWRCGPRRSP